MHSRIQGLSTTGASVDAFVKLMNDFVFFFFNFFKKFFYDGSATRAVRERLRCELYHIAFFRRLSAYMQPVYGHTCLE